MEKNAPEISVIVPVYNVEQFLAKCIDSILSQTFTDFELLLIDDGSPDRCGEICDEYARKDERIRVFHQENAGVSVARNVGLREMQGEYMAFVDPDDYILPNYLKCLYDGLNDKEGVGLVIEGFKSYDVDGNLLSSNRLPNRLIKEKDFGIAICEYSLCKWGYSASKLYNARVIRENQIYFDTRLRNLVDLPYMYQYLLYCDYLVLNSAQEYVYIIYPNSISHTIHPFDAVYSGFLLYQSLLNQMMERWYFPLDKMQDIYKSMMLGFNWALKTDYQFGRSVSRKIRVAHLRKLINENYQVICKYYSPDYKLDKLGKKMLMNRYYCLYDFYITLLIKIHIPCFLYAPHRKG